MANLSTHDLEIMLGGRGDNKLINSLLSESVLSFYWHRYFQLAEIWPAKGEDDFFYWMELTCEEHGIFVFLSFNLFCLGQSVL